METQDGISVRAMRLKVLYTFDDASKANCLARWPHILDVQTAYLDEETQIGIIELKTCIQAIVSASPELLARLGQEDYTVYAYDYSEYETPMVGQGMLSWVLASVSPTPDAPAHQSKTMVTGRVCGNALGLFSQAVQETLEVKLRLVPVPTVVQKDYLDSMQRYRELSNAIPQVFDAQAWKDFLRHNPDLLACTTTMSQQSGRIASAMDNRGIENLHRLLSEGSTPRDLPSVQRSECFWQPSPAQSAVGVPSGASTPQGQRPASRQEHEDRQLSISSSMSHTDNVRPGSSASMRAADFPAHSAIRRGSVQSGYGSCDDTTEPQVRKRAKLIQTDWPERASFNIERQPSSLRVAASTAASVRIHRPTPINPSSATQRTDQEPVRPPTPVAPSNNPRRLTRLPSLLREMSKQSTAQYGPSDDQLLANSSTTSPEDCRYQGLFEPLFSMPSSPPIEYRMPDRSSPVLPPIITNIDSGFMSGSLQDLFDDDAGTTLQDCDPMVSRSETTGEMRSVPPTVYLGGENNAHSPLKDCQMTASNSSGQEQRTARPTVHPDSHDGVCATEDCEMDVSRQRNQEERTLRESRGTDADTPLEDRGRVAQNQQQNPAGRSAIQAGSGHDDTGTLVRREEMADSNNSSKDSVMHSETYTNFRMDSDNHNMTRLDSENVSSAKPSLPPVPTLPARSRSNAGSRPSRAGNKQMGYLASVPTTQNEVQPLLSAVPASDPVMYQANSQLCAGIMSDLPCIETPASGPGGDDKVDSGPRKWKSTQARLEKCILKGQVPPYCENCGAIETPAWRRAWSKEIVGNEEDANALRGDRTCLFWQPVDRDEEDKIIKFKVYKKSLRETDHDFEQVLLCNPCGLWLHKFKGLRPENKWNKTSSKSSKRNIKKSKPEQPPNESGKARRNRARSNKPTESSPVPTDTSSPLGETTPDANDDNDENEEDVQEPPSKRRRANSVEPRRSMDNTKRRWEERDAREALRRAIQSSPARNLDNRNLAAEENCTKSVRRALFPSSPQAEGGPLKSLNESATNQTPRHISRVASRESNECSEDKENQPLENPNDVNYLFRSENFEFESFATPPKRQKAHAGHLSERRLSLPGSSPIRKLAESRMDSSPIRRARVQSTQRISPRRHKANEQSHHYLDLPSLAEIDILPETLGSIDNMVRNILKGDDGATFHDDFLSDFETSKDASSSNWHELISSLVGAGGPLEGDQAVTQHVSPGEDEALMNPILSDPDMQMENICASDFELFSSMLGSGLLPGDAPN